MKRRKFMLSLVGSAAVAGWAGVTFTKGGRKSTLHPGHLVKVKRSTWALGTQVTLTVFHPDTRAAEAAITKAMVALNAVEDILSLYRPESQISRLNREGRLDDAHPYLLEVLHTAQRMSRLSDGAFDVTVQPLYLLHAQQASGTQPAPQALQAALSRIGWRQVQVSGNRVSFSQPGVEITLNGIAQGFAADVVGRVLRENGIEHALIDTGEIEAVGHPLGKDSWTIGVKHPRDPGSFVCLADLKGRSLATSGDYETRFSEDFSRHHLLDPHTGTSPQTLSSVTVAASDGMQADALSTTLFLLGIERGKQMIADMPGTDALFITKSGELIATDGFPMRS